MNDADADVPLIDWEHLDELRAVLGAQRVAELVRPLLAELRTAPASIVALEASDRSDAARDVAHKLRGAVLGVGWQRIAAILSRIEAGSGALARLCSALTDAIEQTARALSIDRD